MHITLNLLNAVDVSADILVSPLFLHSCGAAPSLSWGGSINICKQRQLEAEDIFHSWDVNRAANKP